MQQTRLLHAAVRRVSKPRQLQVPSHALRLATEPDGSGVGRAPLLALLERGGEVRFKLYLWLRWYSQHSTDFEPAPIRLSHFQWALLLALPDPETSGVKRVSTALAQLEDRGLLIRSTERPAAAKPTNVSWWPLDRTSRPPGMPPYQSANGLCVLLSLGYSPARIDCCANRSATHLECLSNRTHRFSCMFTSSGAYGVWRIAWGPRPVLALDILRVGICSSTGWQCSSCASF